MPFFRAITKVRRIPTIGAPQAPMLPSSTIAVVIRAKEPKKPRKADLEEGDEAVLVMSLIL